MSADITGESSEFMDRWRDTQPAFTAYYKKEWHAKVCKWNVKQRKYNHANQNTNGGIERWHHTLKVELKTDKQTIKGRSLVWLLENIRVIENHYWCISANKFQGRIANRTIEGHVHKCLNRAKAIPDEYVKLLEYGSHKCASVRSTSSKYEGMKEHLVTDWDLDSCTCTCGYSLQGNSCKHQVRLLRMDMGFGVSIGLYAFWNCLYSLLGLE